ncbi:MAG: CpsD/CapB family tyrosine-protein kinase [Planctomycetota bacterium]|jgi:capsular exopolysaccharide synthesis family protein
MGKMFDALQKSDKEKNVFIPSDNPRMDVKEPEPSQVFTGDDLDTDLLLKKPKGMDSRLVIKNESKSLIGDQFRILRTHVLRKCREKKLRSILITSAMPQEGKTTIASNFAVGISQCINEKAILVDFDLRKANVAPIFGVNGRAGILEYFSKGVDLSEIVSPTDVDGLLLVTAGSSKIHPSDILAADKVEQLFNELKTRYNDHYIVIDSTPLEVTPEVSIIADKSDAILLVVAAGHSKREQIASAISKIDKNKIIGVALNGVDKRLSYYRSHYRDYYNFAS